MGADGARVPRVRVRFERRNDFAPWAASCGFFAKRVDLAEDLDNAVEAALAHDGPALVDASVNPDEPPLPGKVTYEQAKKFAKSFVSGQPRKASIAATLLKDKIRGARG